MAKKKYLKRKTTTINGEAELFDSLDKLGISYSLAFSTGAKSLIGTDSAGNREENSPKSSPIIEKTNFINIWNMVTKEYEQIPELSFKSEIHLRVKAQCHTTLKS